MTDFRTLARAMLSDTDAWKIINASYPEPPKPAKVTLAENLKAQNIDADEEFLTDAINVTDQFERLRERIGERREGAYELAVKTAEGADRAALTAWDVYQGVVEVEDFRTSGADESNSGRIRRTRSALFGDRARTKARAFKAAKKAS